MQRKITVFFIILTVLFSLIPTGCHRTAHPADTVSDNYLNYFMKKDYKNMYFLLSKSAMKQIPEDEFIKKYTSIFDAIELKSVKVDKYAMQYGEGRSTLPFQATLNTGKCGNLVLTYHMDITEEKGEYAVDWTPSLIFPEMQWGDKVAAGTINPTRGEIFDSSSELLAGNEPGITAYAKVPEIEDVEAFAARAAAVLKVDEEKIIKTVKAHKSAGLQMAALKSYLPNSLSADFEQKLLDIEGMGIDKKVLSNFRYYPFKGEFAHLIGYVGAITKDDIDSKKLEGYDQTGVVGRTGLEKAYDLQLRGKPGWQVYIVREDGSRRSTVYKKEAENGKDLVLSIDASLQHKINQLLTKQYGKNLSGAVVVSDPATGEVISAVSWPTFDPNQFNQPISQKKWEYLNSKEARTPLYNRFAQALLPPGSTYKPFSAVMGLEEKLVSDTTEFPYTISGDEWHPNPDSKSWVIRRQHFSYSTGPLNMHRALIASDNIYFAWIARSLGKERFINYSTKFGMTEAVPFDIPVSKPQISNSGEMDSEALLLDSGYGQGELLITPLQLAAMFGIFGNNGSIMKPHVVKSLNDTVNGRLVPTEEAQPQVWRSNTASSSGVLTVRSILESVVNEGTGQAADVPGMTIAGKTGTAQLGKTKDRLIGWYIGYVIKGGKNYVVTVCTDGAIDVISAKFAVARGIFEHISDKSLEKNGRE